MVLSLLLPLFFASPSNALTCKQIEDRGGYAEFFQTVREKSPVETTQYHSQLLRKSVAAFYESGYSKNMSDEEVDQLGEGVGMEEAKDLDGNLYQMVNVGFGGGNSAVYVYEPNTLNLFPVYFEDGDCSEQGDLPTFPIEKEIKDPSKASTTCATIDPKSPLTSITVEIPLTKENAAYTTKSKISYSLRDGFLEKLASATIEEEIPMTSFSQPKTEGQSWGWGVGTVYKHKDIDPSWHIQFSVRKNTKRGKTLIRGRAYPNITGGYWDKKAFDFESELTCDRDLPISGVKYQRIIEF